MAVRWLIKIVKLLVPLKDHNFHPSCKLSEGICIYGEAYVGETTRNVENVGQNIILLIINQNQPNI